MQICIKEWKLANNAHISYDIPPDQCQRFTKDQHSSYRRLLNKLVQAGALPGSDSQECSLRLVHSADQQPDVELLEEMAAEGLVECVLFRGDHSWWQLTAAVVGILKMTVEAEAPRNILGGVSPGRF